MTLYLLACATMSVHAETIVVALWPAEHVGVVTTDEAEAYYAAIASCLGGGDVRLLERKALRVAMDERDLALALDADASNQIYAQASKALKVDRAIVPTMSRIENDYILSLRLLALPSGATKSCSIRKTRVLARLSEVAREQAAEVLGTAPGSSGAPATEPPDRAASGPAEARDIQVDELRQLCQQARADSFFPMYWQRIEKIRSENPDVASAQLRHYYLTLVNLTARAATPPPGMVFVPGGYTPVQTSAGARKLWVEPFFIDRCEVSVRDFGGFLDASAKDVAKARKFRPITMNDPQLFQPNLPVTGISFEAAETFAVSRGKSLPTCLQWRRAAYGDDGRSYPCGDQSELPRCRLKSATQPSPLSAIDAGGDASAYGCLHMTGNVREWTRTWFAPALYAKASPDRPEEPAAGTLKIVAGGSWRTGADAASCESADKVKPGEAFDDVGFRCVAAFTLWDIARDPKRDTSRLGTPSPSGAGDQ
jgi:formylglycine-generating enzyme required for sulfatase activity